MKDYIGTKLIKAMSENKGDEEGYKVEYDGGYISWSPKDVFEKAYQESGSMSFGHATEIAEAGNKVCRKNWNGAGMYAVIMPGFPEGVPANEVTAVAHDVEVGAIIVINPYWVLKTANGSVSTWAPSGSDSLAKDWCIVK